MTTPHDGDSREGSTAGPVVGDGGALRAGHGPSSTPPSPTPPAGETGNAESSEAKAESPDADLVESDIDALLADTQRERDEYLELAKRAQADFENYRKRMTAEVQAAGARGKGELLREVVPVLDDLERAIQAAGLDPEGDSEDGLAHGVLLVFRSLRDSLGRNGVEAVDPKGERFDPTSQEALSTVAADGVESGVVVEVLQKGYKLGDQLIRPARVVVSE